MIDELPSGLSVEEAIQVDFEFVRRTGKPHGYRTTRYSFPDLDSVQEAIDRGGIILAQIVSDDLRGRHAIHLKRVVDTNDGRVVIANDDIYNGDFVEEAMRARARIDGFNAFLLSNDPG